MEIQFATQLDQSDLDTLHDVIFNATGRKYLTNQQILEYWNKFPESIQLDAIQYGVSDTPTRDNMHVWLKTHGNHLR